MKVKMGDFVLAKSFSDSNPIELSGVRFSGNPYSNVPVSPGIGYK